MNGRSNLWGEALAWGLFCSMCTLLFSPGLREVALRVHGFSDFPPVPRSIPLGVAIGSILLLIAHLVLRSKRRVRGCLGAAAVGILSVGLYVGCSPYVPAPLGGIGVERGRLEFSRPPSPLTREALRMESSRLSAPQEFVRLGDGWVRIQTLVINENEIAAIQHL